MDFECCFGTSVPIFAGNTVVPRRGPAKHGDDPTPYERSEARDLPTNIGLDPVRTRSVRRATGLLDTALPESTGPAHARASEMRCVEGPPVANCVIGADLPARTAAMEAMLRSGRRAIQLGGQANYGRDVRRNRCRYCVITRTRWPPDQSA